MNKNKQIKYKQHTRAHSQPTEKTLNKSKKKNIKQLKKNQEIASTHELRVH